MLFLYDANLRDLKWNGEPLFEASRAEVKEVLNGDCQLKVVYPITNSKLFEQLVVDKLISAPSPTLGRQFFRIKTITEEDDRLEIVCEPISDDIMKRRIKPMVINGTDCQTALNRMVASSRTRLGDFLFESDITKPHVFTFEEEETLYTVLMDGKHSILGTWEGELVRDNRLIAIKSQRGEDRGEVLSTHHNISSYQRELDGSAVYTRVIVQSTFKVEGEKEDRHLEVTIDSPLINNYPYVNEVVFENNQLTDIESMKTWGKAKFTHEGIDKVKDSLTIKAYQVDGTILHLGDTVSIKSYLHKADFKKKVVAYTWDALAESYIDFTFDDKVVYGGTSQSTINSFASEILHANDYGLSTIQSEIDASNRRFDLKEEKLREKIDLGLSRAEAKAEGQVAQVNQAVTGLQEKTRKLTELSHQYDSVLANHLRKLNETTDLAKVAEQNALMAQNIGNQAKVDAKNALDKALQYRGEIIAEATRLDGLQRQTLNSQIATAKSQAISEANRLLEVSKSKLDMQISSTNKAIIDAKKALETQVSTISLEVTRTKESLKSLVVKSDFNQVKQRLNTAESSLIQLGNRITTEISETNTKIDGITLGSRNYIRHGYIVNRGCSRFNYDIVSNTWDCVATKQSSVWGNGFFINSGGHLVIPRGYTFLVSLEVNPSIVCTWNNDVNNSYHGSTSGNDHDNISRRRHSNRHLLAGRWQKVWFSYTAKDDVSYDIFDIGSHFGIVTTIVDIPFKMRNIQGEFATIPSDYTPAPEDTMTEIESVKTTVTQTSNGLSQLSTKVTQTEGKVLTAETKIKQLIGEVSSKVSKIDYDNLKNTVTRQGSSISQVESKIVLKAEKTYVDNVKKLAYSAMNKANTNAATLTRAQSELTVVNNAIKSKVSQTDFNAATGRLSTAESTLRQQAGEIAKRLTSTQVESAILAKGYQNKANVDSNITGRGYITDSGVNSKLQNYVTSTTLSNSVRETTSSFTRSLSRVEKLIPRDVARTNLIKGTADGEQGSRKINSRSNVTHRYLPTNDSGRGEWNLEVRHQTSNLFAGWSWKLSKNMVQGQKYSVLVDIWIEPDKANAVLESGAIEVKQHAHGNNAQIIVCSHTFNKSSVRQGLNRFAFTFTAMKSTTVLEQTEFYIFFTKNGFMNIRRPIMVEGEIIPSQWSLAPEEQTTIMALHTVKDTVDSHSRIFTQLGTLPNTVKWATIKQTIDKVTTTIGDSVAISKTVQTALVSLQVFKDLQTGLSSQQSLTANHYALRFLKGSGDVLSQLNLNSGGVKIQGKLIHLNGQTLIDNGVITSAKIVSLDAGKITTGYLNASRIASQAITGDKIKFDQAYFNQMTANEALFKTIFVKSAFITAVQAVTLSANRIVGGMLTATNGAMSLNLNQANITFNQTATIDFNSTGNALRRKVGDVTGFLHFNNAKAGGTYVGLGVTSHNEGVKSQDTGRFAGIRIFRSNDRVDQTEVYGDTIYLGHAFNGNAVKLTATRLNGTYEMVDIINAIKSLWRCWLHFNNVRWNPADGNFSRAVINEYNAHNIG